MKPKHIILNPSVRNSHLHSFNDRARPFTQRGFALVIALSLMAFVVLLLLSITTLVRVSAVNSNQAKQMQLAQANALLGLNIALGELQKHAGPDRRVSALADIMTLEQPHINRPAVDVHNRHWMGVWNAEGGLQNWLVSGNEGIVAPATVFVDAAVNYSPADVMTGVVAGPSPDAAITISDEPGVVLVGSASLGDSNVNSVVVAPRVGIDDQNAYAWWIADEGVKARADLVDRYEADGLSPASAQSASAQRNAMELMDGFASFDPATADVAKLDKLLVYPDVAFLGVAEDDRQAHFHDVTLYSTGLLTDTRNGGLKRDLSYLFELSEADFLAELPNLYQDADLNLVKDDEGTTPIAQIAVTTPAWYFTANPQLNSVDFQPWQLMGLPFGPTWEQLRSFYRLKDDVDVFSNSIAIRPQRENQTGVYPVLLQARVFTGISRVMVDSGADLIPQTDDDNMDVFAHFRIMFMLGNPYSVDMDISDMNLTFYMRGGEIPVSFTSETFGRWTELFNQQRFHITAGTIPPGEARIYTLDSSGADTTANGAYPFFAIEAADQSGAAQPTLVTHQLINEFDELVSLRCKLPGGPYTRADTTNAYLKPGEPHAGSDGIVVTWAGNPTDYRDVLQLSGPIGSGGLDGKFYDGDSGRFSDYIDATTLDGQVAWGGGTRWMMSDVSYRDFGNYIREVNIRAPYRSIRSDPYNPSQLATLGLGGQLFPIINSNNGGVTYAQKFGSEELLYYEEVKDVRAGWGMLYASYEGQTPHYLNRLFDIPTSDAPVNSLGQLQHFNASGYIPTEPASKVYDLDYTWAKLYFNTVYALSLRGVGYDDFPTLAFSDDYAIGNSFSSRYVERDRVYHGDSRLVPRDASWLLNAALWDRFYFSSLPQSGNFDVTDDKLINHRYRPIDGVLPPSADALRASSTSFAERIGAKGSFNVNSTSVKAWKAFLAGTLGVPYQGKEHVDEAVFARTPRQDANPTADGAPKDPLAANAWKGYRTLTLTEIDALADEIVNQVKLRGPFLSLEQFVNRLPVASTLDPNGIGIRGALQAAIEEAGLNPLAAGVSADFNAMNPAASDIVDPAHGYRTQYDGGPGQITQGDLLQPLGPYISVRSDTFKIRSSGMLNDPVSGDPLAQTWCEAVVQRVPEFVDDSQAANTSLSPTDSNRINEVNRQFGRRFQIVSFRWLDKSEL